MHSVSSTPSSLTTAESWAFLSGLRGTDDSMLKPVRFSSISSSPRTKSKFTAARSKPKDSSWYVIVAPSRIVMPLGKDTAMSCVLMVRCADAQPVEMPEACVLFTCVLLYDMKVLSAFSCARGFSKQKTPRLCAQSTLCKGAKSFSAVPPFSKRKRLLIDSVSFPTTSIISVTGEPGSSRSQESSCPAPVLFYSKLGLDDPAPTPACAGNRIKDIAISKEHSKRTKKRSGRQP